MMRKIAIGLAAAAIAMGGSTMAASARTIIKYVCPSSSHGHAAYYPRGGRGGVNITKNVYVAPGSTTGNIYQYRRTPRYGAAYGRGRAPR